MGCLFVSPTLLCICNECFFNCSEMCAEGVTVMLSSVAEHRAEGGGGKLEAGAPGETAASG